MMAPAAPVMTMVYMPPTGYLMPQPICIPPPTYVMPQPDVFDSNLVWQGTYQQDGENHHMTWFKFMAAPGQVLRGKGTDDIGEFVLQGYVEPNCKAHFEKQYLGKHTVLYEGDLIGERITGRWNVQGLSDTFEMTRCDKRWAGVYMQDGNEVEMIFNHLNIWNNRINGRGKDEVGEFEINGEFKSNGQVTFTKQYIGQHSVLYEGQYDGNRIISGQWKVPSHNLCDAFEISKGYDPNWDL